ncbi:hypothetical protein E1B28_011334 [Marasmius oreades]|uniref:RRM domain-containing protein n=1 Tax=Marasmius oreades TaxID=181124 RepID=A0A9P7URZ2_9AGAR|nr:uncharacterized protein E1B28_011334 [Marasmius oreades]KAG7089674.1 hypothetical protein E1B28_011334 [Marasmius oreades]
MPPKKAKKISLNEFLGNSTLGSWADEMDALPSAPAMRSDDDQGRSNDRYGRRDDFMSSRPDRAAAPPREDLPLPTQPPFTAFVGNLSFDLTEAELGDFFSPSQPKSVKIIRDRDDKPKGFGYVEFEDVEGLKDAIAKTGSSFSGRIIRISVAEAPKERPGFGADDSKFDSPWRRDGPLPDEPSRDSSRRRFDAPRPESLPSVAEGVSDWRSNKPRAALEPEAGSMRRKNIGFGSDNAGAADREETWTIGGKFKPSEDKDASTGNKFGSRGRGDMGPPKDPASAADEGSDWRSARKPARDSTSPSTSTPPTPQMGRRKLELLPRSGSGSNVVSPLSSPKIGPSPTASGGSNRANPFGAAKPVDVTSREREVSERLDKDRERLSMSRTSSRTGVERTTSRPGMERTSSRSGNERPTLARNPSTSSSATTSNAPPSAKTINPSLAANVRPSFSFASAAANKGEKKKDEQENGADEETNIPMVDDVRDQLGEVTI